MATNYFGVGLIPGLSGYLAPQQTQNFMGGLQALLAGSPTQVEQLPQYTPSQTSALEQLLSMGLQGLQDPYAGFEPIEQQARTQFQQQTVPSLAERFASRGSSALSSPAFASQLGQAGAGLEQNLAALRAQYGLQNRSGLANLLSLGLQPQFSNLPMQQQPGLLQQLLPVLGRLGAHAGAAYLSGGATAPASLAALLGGM